MYADPSLVRHRTIKFYASDREAELIDRLVRLTGQQRQVMLRDMVMPAIERALAAEAESAAVEP